MSKERDAIEDILADPDNGQKTVAEVAADILAAVAGVKYRYAVFAGRRVTAESGPAVYYASAHSTKLEAEVAAKKLYEESGEDVVIVATLGKWAIPGDWKPSTLSFMKNSKVKRDKAREEFENS